MLFALTLRIATILFLYTFLSLLLFVLNVSKINTKVVVLYLVVLCIHRYAVNRPKNLPLIDMNAGGERERCTRCSRRRSMSGALPLRRWLKPLECKHKRDCEVPPHAHSDCKAPSSNRFLKFWKTKVLLGSVRSLQHYFNTKVNRELYTQNGECTRSEEASVTVGSTDIAEAACAPRRGAMRCHHSAGHSVLRGHQNHATPESCALYCQLSKHGWYWGGITSREAEDLLAGEHDNVFLVRDSYNACHLLCVSFRCVGRTLHTRLRHANGLFSFNNETFVPVSSISEHCKEVEVASILFETPVRLARPLNRFAKLDSLQLLCRFVVRQSVPPDQLTKLPLPRTLIRYLSLGSDYIVTVS